MPRKRKSILLDTSAGLFFLGLGLVLVTVFAFAATAVYEVIVPPTDMHLAGLLTAALMLYVAPAGGILCAVGGIVWIGLTLAGRGRPNRDGSER